MKIKKWHRKRVLKAIENITKNPKWFIKWEIKNIEWNNFQKDLLEKIENRNKLQDIIWIYWALWWGKTFFWAYLTALLSFYVERTNLLVIREYKKDAIDTNLKKIVEFLLANWFKENIDFKYVPKQWYVHNLLTDVYIMAEWARWWQLDSKIRSKEFYFAWLEEASFLSVDNLKLVLERLRWSKSKRFGSPFTLITNNPDNISDMKDFLDKMVREWKAIEIKTTLEDNKENLEEYYAKLDWIMDERTKNKMLQWHYNVDEAYFFSHLVDIFDWQLYYYSLDKKKEELWFEESELRYIIWYDEWFTDAPSAFVFIITNWEQFLIEDVKEIKTLWWYTEIFNLLKEFAEENWKSIDDVEILADPAMAVKKRDMTWLKSALNILEEFGLNISKWNNENRYFIKAFTELVVEKKIWFNFYKTQTLIEELKKWKRKYDKETRKYLDIPDGRAKNDDALTAFKYWLSWVYMWNVQVNNKIKKQMWDAINLNDYTQFYFKL